METVLGILPGLHSNKCVGIDIVAQGPRLPEVLLTPGAWETFVAINLRVLPTEASVPRPHYVILYTKLCTVDIEGELREVRAALRARETTPPSDPCRTPPRR